MGQSAGSILAKVPEVLPPVGKEDWETTPNVVTTELSKSLKSLVERRPHSVDDPMDYGKEGKGIYFWMVSQMLEGIQLPFYAI